MPPACVSPHPHSSAESAKYQWPHSLKCIATLIPQEHPTTIAAAHRYDTETFSNSCLVHHILLHLLHAAYFWAIYTADHSPVGRSNHAPHGHPRHHSTELSRTEEPSRQAPPQEPSRQAPPQEPSRQEPPQEPPVPTAPSAQGEAAAPPHCVRPAIVGAAQRVPACDPYRRIPRSQHQ